MTSRRLWLKALAAAPAALGRAVAQVIEFESGGLRYLTQTRNGVTVMFAILPTLIREYAVIQVAISNGSSRTWNFKPEDFRFARAEGGVLVAMNAGDVVRGFMRYGGRDDVVKLVTAYENGLYGMSRPNAANGYEDRRQSAMAAVQSTKLKAAAAASAIVLAAVKLKPGESTDGAVFFVTGGKNLGAGKLIAEVAASRFEFDSGT
ncbi:MAG: hypothetical protein R2762_18430 [Bryobacteraceae bacterium]